MKTRFASALPARPAALLALLLGLALNLSALRAGTETAPAQSEAAKSCLTCGSKTRVETASKTRASQKAKVKKTRSTDVAPREITGSHLKQRVVLRRFPETVAPVEVFDREQIERRGEATVAGFLSRQSIFR